MPPTSNAAVAIITIPTNGVAFAQIVERLTRDGDGMTPAALQARLRKVFPLAIVRARELSGERPAWYVYRDGGWRSSLMEEWWTSVGLPQVKLSADGFLTEANATALDLLGVDRDDLGTRHFTDFVVPGALGDAVTLFEVVHGGSSLTATILLRPTSGHVIGVDIRAWRDGDSVVGVLRLADDIEPASPSSAVPPPPVRCRPETDAAFRGYVELALSRMPEPTPDGLALRLRRLYPHADVTAGENGWLASREPAIRLAEGGAWWSDPSLPTVRYDAQALIVWANEAAESLLGQSLVGHYWQEFVTPGSTEQVSAMLAILAEVGRAESRFRMPRADGSLLEFDSYTEVDGESYTTIMRARD